MKRELAPTPPNPLPEARPGASPLPTTNGESDNRDPAPAPVRLAQARPSGSPPPSPGTTGDPDPTGPPGPRGPSRLPRPSQWSKRRKFLTLGVLAVVLFGLGAGFLWWNGSLFGREPFNGPTWTVRREPLKVTIVA